MFTKSTFMLIVLSAISLGCLISYFSYVDFINNTKQLETEYIASRKAILQREVSNVETLINFRRSKLNNRIRENIKRRVIEGHSIASNIYDKYRNSKPKNEIIDLIKEALRPLRFFNNRGYIFITALDGTGILHPTATQFEGKNVLHLRNQQGVAFAKNILDITKEKGEGYYQYDWTKPNEEGQFAKLSFFKLFKPYNWAIGTGDYIIEVERTIQRQVLERIGEIQFGKEGYIFVVNYDGVVMMNRGNRSLIGKNILSVTDINGVRVAEEIIKLAQNPNWDGYFNYTWKKLSSSTVSPKIAFHKTVPDWKWYYGSGVYLDDVQVVIAAQRSKLKNHLLFQLFLISVTIITALAMLFFLTQRRSKELNLDLSQLLEYFQSLSSNPAPLNTDNFKYSEFKQLAHSANIMFEDQKNSELQRIRLEQQIQQSQKMDAVTQLVGGIAHDFNNLLGAILGFGELLEAKLGDHPVLEGYCHQINTAGKRGAKLTRKLLSLTNKKNAEAEQCNINHLLEQEKEFLKKSLTAKINLEFRLDKQLWPVWIDKSDFQDVILNLCVNAMHAMKEGQQDSLICISTDNMHIKEDKIGTTKLNSGDYVRISVSDNGMGMDETVKNRLFEPFFTTRESGSGLGLSQAYSFMHRSEGTITVNTTLQSGTEFQLIFPKFKPQQAQSDANLSAGENVYKGHETILIVDDEEPLRELCSTILCGNGYNILQAENGIDALTILENETVDLLLSDVIMPNMDGNLLAERVKKLYPHIKIQLVSGYTKDKQLSGDNIDLYNNMLHKPIDTHTLLQHVRQLLD